MNVLEAVKHLRKIGWHVVEVKGGWKAHRIGHKEYCPPPNCNPEWRTILADDVYTDRKLIKLASVYTSNNNQNTTYKRNIKKYSNGARRAKERRVLHSTNEDAVDTLSNSRGEEEEDVWSWT